MPKLEMQFDHSQTTYTDNVAEFLSLLTPQEFSTQFAEAIDNLSRSFTTFGDKMQWVLNQGQTFTRATDAVFQHDSQRLAIVIIGELSPEIMPPRLTVKLMLPEEFDRDFRSVLFQKETDAFERARDQVLLSMDEAQIRAFFQDIGFDMPLDTEAFWRTVHITREQTPSLPMEERIKSKQWLDEHKFLGRFSPYSLDETPFVDPPHSGADVTYVQPVHQKVANGTFIVWLEVICNGKVQTRVPITGRFRTNADARESALEAMTKMINQIKTEQPQIKIISGSSE